MRLATLARGSLLALAFACGSNTGSDDAGDDTHTAGMSGRSAGQGGTAQGAAGTGGVPSGPGSGNGGAAGALAGAGGASAGASGSGNAAAANGDGGSGTSGTGGANGDRGGASAGAAGAAGLMGGAGSSGAGSGGAAPGGTGGRGGGAGKGGKGEGGGDAGQGGAGGGGSGQCPADGDITYMLSRSTNPSSDESDAYERITAAMDEALDYYNCYTSISRMLSISYNPSVETADGNPNGSIRFGSNRSYMNYITAMHETSHVLGVGSSEWDALISDGVFTGEAATAELRAITGNPDDELHGDLQHFWPYGLNYTSEVMGESDLLNHLRLVVAIRVDLGFED